VNVKKDRYGNEINVGDVVLSAITINHDTYRGFTFATNIVRKQGRLLILDGVHCWGYLHRRKAAELVKVTPETDLWKVEADFIRDFRQRSVE
jgi:hypothetical protein